MRQIKSIEALIKFLKFQKKIKQNFNFNYIKILLVID